MILRASMSHEPGPSYEADMLDDISVPPELIHDMCEKNIADELKELADKESGRFRLLTAINSQQHTPLFTACFHGSFRCAAVLVDAAAKETRAMAERARMGPHDIRYFLDRTVPDGCTALHVVCYRGHPDCCEILLASGASVDVTNRDGMSPLFTACFNGHQPCAQLLLDAGASVGLPDKQGKTPLHALCVHGRPECAPSLIAAGANINLTDLDGHSPLFTACYHNSYR